MSAGTPLVSIIIPTYNDCAWICDAIDSALAQTYSEREIIVVDDGSTDGTSDLIGARYGAEITCIRQDNRGLPAARNAGIAAARGAYVQFLDADDLLLPTKLALQVAVLERNPACDVVYSDFAFFDGLDGVRRPSGFLDRYRQGRVFSDLLADNFVVVHAALSRLDAVRSVGGFDEDLSACEDYDLWLRLAAAGSIFFCTPEPLAVYRRREHSMSAEPTRQISATIDVIGKVPAYADLTDEERRLCRARLAALREMKARTLALHALRLARTGRLHRVAGAMIRAFLADPAALPRSCMRLVTGRGWRSPQPERVR